MTSPIWPCHRNDDYLAFVRTLPCAATGDTRNVVAHHVRLGPGGGAIGLKPSDYRCVPLTAYEHQHLHNMGERAFWREISHDFEDVIFATVLQYIHARAPRPVAWPDDLDLHDGARRLKQLAEFAHTLPRPKRVAAEPED